MESLEELYGLTKKDVGLERFRVRSDRWLEVFVSPGPVMVEIDFPEFTCKCPKTGQPDFAIINLKYIPKKYCVELKSFKYFLNSFRDEGHFHEEVIFLMAKDLVGVLDPVALHLSGEFNTRGGMSPIVEVDYREGEGWKTEI